MHLVVTVPQEDREVLALRVTMEVLGGKVLQDQLGRLAGQAHEEYQDQTEVQDLVDQKDQQASLVDLEALD